MNKIEARVLEILSEIKHLAVEYQKLTGRPLGVAGEVGEHVAARHLDLQLAEVREKSFDATRLSQSGLRERIQIKSRTCESGVAPKGRLSRISKDAACEVVMLVLLDKDTLDAWAIYEASFSEVRIRLDKPGSKSRNERGQLSAQEFLKLPSCKQVWPTIKICQG